MNQIIIYMVKTSIYLAGFYLIYAAFLSRDTMYTRNRIFILCSLLLSFVLPAFTVRTNETGVVAYFGRTLSEILITGNSSATGNELQSVAPGGMTVILLRIYITGMVAFAVKLITDLFRLVFMIKNNKDKNGILIRFNGLDTAGFSALGHIFINKSVSAEESDEIFKHEMSHLKNNHFIDIMLIEIAKILLWFNPVIHLLNRSLRAVHEFQADEGYLSTGIPVARYQNLLLNHILKSRIFIASNSFSNPTLIKKRMIMMTKKRSNQLANLKLLMVIPVAVITMLVFSACGKSTKTTGNTSEIAPPPPPPPPPPGDINVPNAIIGNDTIYQIAENMPVFPGGEKALVEFLYKNISYPEAAKKNNIQGKVILRFCVTGKGAVDHVEVLKGVEPSLNEEAIRVVKLLPKWQPAVTNGKPISVWYSVPVSFALK